MIRKSLSPRAATAALIRATIISSIDNRFAGEMSAAFRKFLIFDVTAGQSGFFQFANCSGNFFAFAETSVRIDDRGNPHRMRDVTGEPDNFVASTTNRCPARRRLSSPFPRR